MKCNMILWTRWTIHLFKIIMFRQELTSLHYNYIHILALSLIIWNKHCQWAILILSYCKTFIWFLSINLLSPKWIHWWASYEKDWLLHLRKRFKWLIKLSVHYNSKTLRRQTNKIQFKLFTKFNLPRDIPI